MVKHQKTFLRAVVRSIHDHSCALPLEDTPISYHIYQGIFVQLRRKLWKWVTVNPLDPQSKRHLKSAAQISAEEMRHLDRYPRMVHPFSSFRFIWEMIMVPVTLVNFIMIPVAMGLDHLLLGFTVIKTVIDLVNVVDIFLWFFTGYYDEDVQTVVMSPSKVAKHYILTLFVFDLISSVPYSLIIYLSSGGWWLHFFSGLYFFKVARMATFITYIYKISERRQCLTGNIKIICFTITQVIFVIWTTSVIYRLTRIFAPIFAFEKQIKNFPMLATLFEVTKALMTVGVSQVINTSNLIMMLEVMCITFGSILEVIIIATVVQIYQKHSTSRNKFKHLLEEICEYMKYKELPNHLKEKVLRYVDFKYQKHIFREEDVLNNLSSVLKHDILLQRCKNMVEKVDFFKDLPPHVMLRIVTKLRSEIFLPSDVIVLAGYAGHAMYFIYMGTVAVYTGTGKEICHLADGDHFGEIALVINEPRVATVIAVKECELFKLSRKDFQDAIEPFPEVSKKIKMLAMERLKSTLQMMSEDNSKMSEEREENVLVESDSDS